MALMRKKKKAAVEQARAGVRQYACLHAPVITEKSSTLPGKGGSSTVAFYVDRTASKDEIKQAVEKVLKVEVAAVRTLNTMGKLKRTTRAVGRTARHKKAYVTLKPGHTIGIIEGV